jgi:hypothetical protein
MNRFFVIVVCALVLILSACGSPSNPNPNPNPNPQPSNQLAGTYNGELIIGDLFALTTFTVDSAGTVTGTTTSKDLGAAPVGEKGTITGTVKGAGSINIELNLTVESPTVGKRTMAGSGGIYDSNSKKMSATGLTVRDASGTFIAADGIIIGSKE